MNSIITILVVLCTLSGTLCKWVKEMENKGGFEGDIVLDPDEFEHGWNVSRKFASVKGGRWPGAVVPYVIDGSIATQGVQAINAAIANYQKYTCIRWKQRTTERAYVFFFRGGGCFSPIGYRAGRINRISLATGCWAPGIVMHEMGHTVGFYHEQSRPDRDKYVRIIFSNIQKGMEYNFNKQTYGQVDSLGTPYDYYSMMHYGSTAFGIGRRMTIQTIDPSKQNVIGNREGFSATDIKQLKLMYCGSTKPEPKPVVVNPPTQDCVNKNKFCASWAKKGYCTRTTGSLGPYMKLNCCLACRGAGSGGGNPNCLDKDSNCSYYVKKGYCQNYRPWMELNCKKSCRIC